VFGADLGVGREGIGGSRAPANAWRAFAVWEERAGNFKEAAMRITCRYPVVIVGLTGLLALVPLDATAQARRPAASRAKVVNAPGRFIPRLPATRVTFSLGPSRYFYHAGAFFRPVDNGYVVVRAPLGALTVSLPGGATTPHVRGRVFFRHGKTFFVEVGEGYEVVEAPVGATVPELPWGYETIEIGSEALYHLDGVDYRYDPGRDTYLVVEPPLLG
jgi:hypothetical protein